ncbi:unnamed protein product [Mytilus coruscus]|uniref:Uncharacterized protein n=1 Tax=Mytilus coruscus TaxID=42192 RepID=A0A6J8B9S9_MYTCO|nr:unnamed protein product [Mytilus coruscus]
MNLEKKEKLILYSNGNLSDGFCTIALHAMDCKFPSFRVSVNKVALDTCSAKVTFIGTSFNVIGSQSRELSCFPNYHNILSINSKTMVVTVIEDPKATSTYGFNLTVMLECVRSSFSGHEMMETNESKSIAEIEYEINDNRIIGAVVGCSLAAMFLVILCIAYTYNKNKPTYRQQRDILYQPSA